jgi:Fe-S-cluster containining protein
MTRTKSSAVQRDLPVVQATGTLPQLVPSQVCLSCHVCCRFPAADSFLRPYFTAEEIRAAVTQGLDPSHFTDPTGSQISLTRRDPTGEGYLCPAFDTHTFQCGIYETRPLDCQIYPLAVMWSADGEAVVLGYDAKCPFVAPGLGRGEPSGVRREALDARETLGVRREARETSDSLPLTPDALRLTEYAEKIAALIEREEHVQRFAAHPELIGRYQDDVVVLKQLSRLTDQLKLTPRARLQPVTVADRAVIEAALANHQHVQTELSCYAFAPHMVWRRLFSYSWTELAGHLCLFAENPDGIFMPLPPLGAGRIAEALSLAFGVMQERNGTPGVTRVEGIPEELKPELESLGYRVTPKDSDYLYRIADLVQLAGDRYKSQRAACNQFTRSQHFRVEPYRTSHQEACLTLYRRWVVQQEARGELDMVARQMLKDAATAHEIGLGQADGLGLTGLVVFVDDALCGYTLGYDLPRRAEPAPSVFCVLFEVADRSMPGLAQFIFRECCREAARRGHEWVNTMDDSGLPGLARSKTAYHPARLIANYIATQPQS